MGSSTGTGAFRGPVQQEGQFLPRFHDRSRRSETCVTKQGIELKRFAPS